MKKNKRRLTQNEEFEVMKLVLDKFLWVGILIILYGLYLMATGDVANTLKGLTVLIAGIVVMIVFMVIMIREYEFLR